MPNTGSDNASVADAASVAGAASIAGVDIVYCSNWAGKPALARAATAASTGGVSSVLLSRAAPTLTSST